LKVLLPATVATAVFSQASCTGRFGFHFYNLLVSINVNQVSNSYFDVVSKLVVVSIIFGKTYSIGNFDIVSKLLGVSIKFGKTYSIGNFDIVLKLLVVSIIFGRQLMNYYDVMQTTASKGSVVKL
jgi:hypothetical protein